MKIRLIEHGCPEDRLPSRAHANDVGADVFCARKLGSNLWMSAQHPFVFTAIS